MRSAPRGRLGGRAVPPTSLPMPPSSPTLRTWAATTATALRAITERHPIRSSRPARRSSGDIDNPAMMHRGPIRRRLAGWVPAEWTDHSHGHLARRGLPLLPAGDGWAELVVGSQARGHAGQVHRRLRTRHLSAERARLAPNNICLATTRTSVATSTRTTAPRLWPNPFLLDATQSTGDSTNLSRSPWGDRIIIPRNLRRSVA